MDDNKFEKDKDIIDDSLEFCADIKRYYEAEELDRLDFGGYLTRKDKPKKDKKEQAEPIVIIVNAFIVQETIVNGSSMSPTLESADKLLIDKIFYKVGDLKRYDIIVFDYHHSSVYIKRIIGLPGEKVTISEGKVYIDGKLLKDDPLSADIMSYSGMAKDGISLGENEYFVLGDNRNNSYDSRYEQVGIVNKSSIIGKVWIRISPILKFGAVN